MPQALAEWPAWSRVARKGYERRRRKAPPMRRSRPVRHKPRPSHSQAFVLSVPCQLQAGGAQPCCRR